MLNMNKLIIVLAVVILISISCEIDVKKSFLVKGKNIELISYSSEDKKLSITYPSEWVLIEPQYDILFAAKDPNKEELNVIDVILLSRSINNNSSYFLEKVDSDLENMNREFDSFSLYEKRDISVNNMEALRVNCSFKEEGSIIQSYLYYINGQDMIYSIGLSSKIRDFSHYSSIYETIMNDLEIK